MTETVLGTLYLLPAPLGEKGEGVLPEYARRLMLDLEVFAVERLKTARHFLRAVGYTKHFDEIQMFELSKRTDAQELPEMLAPALAGKDIGLLSEAGVPGVADPGARLVHLAHRRGVKVQPLVGPSSILMALMASGMNGQHFTFTGYLSPKRHELAKDLKRIESKSSRQSETQIFIETPYRNNAVFETALQVLAPSTLFCVATDITLDSEYIKTHSIKEWKRLPKPDLHKRPTVFLLLGNS